MTILNLVPDTGDDLPARQISRRIRGLMAERRISGVKMAAAIGMNQRAFARRYADEVDWSVNEIGSLAQVLGVPFGELCAIRDSNPEPADSKPVGRLLSIVGRIPIGPPLPTPKQPETSPRPRPRLVLVGRSA